MTNHSVEKQLNLACIHNDVFQFVEGEIFAFSRIGHKCFLSSLLDCDARKPRSILQPG